MSTPLPSANDSLPWLRLTLMPGLSPRAQHQLLRAFGSPEGVCAAAFDDIEALAGRDVAVTLAKGAPTALVDAALAWASQPGHQLVTLGDADYPRRLREISDPPAVLYLRGRRELLARPCIAIVGSRNASPQGLRDAHAFAQALSEAGFCVASGLALGIDAAAHRGGLAAAGSSIAVMGTGADRIYPARNRDLALELERSGCLLSEFAVGTAATAGNFPRRNRLISGLALGVLIVEAALRSGSLITARFAAEQGRDVFAIPGSIHSALSKGCHELIKQGAKLVECADDVLAEFGHEVEAIQEKPAVEEDPLLQAMGFAPVSFDHIAQNTGLAAAALAAQISALELEGRVAALPGGLFQRIQ